MISYLLYELSLTKAKNFFYETIQNLEQENEKMLKEINILKTKEQFYAQISSQLENKTEEVIELSSEIAKLKTELEILKNNK